MARRQSFACRVGRYGKELFRPGRELQAIDPGLILIPDGCGTPHSSAIARHRRNTKVLRPSQDPGPPGASTERSYARPVRMTHPHRTRQVKRQGQIHTKALGACAQVWGGATSSFFFSQDKSNTTHSVQEFLSTGFIQFLSQVGYVHVDHIVQRRVPARLIPNIPSEHFSRNNAALVAKEVLK